jgi:hypothetical protein
VKRSDLSSSNQLLLSTKMIDGLVGGGGGVYLGIASKRHVTLSLPSVMLKDPSHIKAALDITGKRGLVLLPAK